MNKENRALELIREQLQTYENPVIACSFGKDSLTVLHLVKSVADELDKHYQVLWNNTGVHYPDIYSLKSRLEKEWNLDIVETKAQKSFWEIVKEYGYPGIQSSERSKDRGGTACCKYIKKKPTEDAIKESNWDLYFDGLTAYESDNRYMAIKRWGINHYHKTFGIQKCHPIGWWSAKDVWNYIEKYDIPYPKVYDQEVGDYTKLGYTEQICGHDVDRAIRNGCWCCTLALKSCPEKMEQLRTYYPKMWEHLMKSGLAKEIAKIKLNGQGSLFDGYFTEETQNDYLESRPCFFDQI